MKNAIWNIVSIIGILFLSAMTWHFYGANKASYNEIILLTEHKNILNVNIAKIAEQKKSLEDKLAALIAENAETLANINKANAKIIEAIASEYKANEEDILAGWSKSRSDITAVNKELSDKISEIQFLKKSLKKIDKKLQEAKTKPAINLKPIVITGPKNVSGKILEVNKAYRFVIVNLGSDDGVSPGDTLFVSRRKALIGKVVVEETAQKYSAAKILYKTLGDVVGKGDTVTN